MINEEGDIHFVAFKGTVANRVLSKLEVYPKHIIESSTLSIENFVGEIQDIRTRYVVGLGEYSGVDQCKLRIETRCNKNFRNNQIEKSDQLQLDNFLIPRDKSKSATGLGNSWCNLLSVLMLNNPNRNYLYSFIHIPKNFKVEDATKEILKILPHNPTAE